MLRVDNQEIPSHPLTDVLNTSLQFWQCIGGLGKFKADIKLGVVSEEMEADAMAADNDIGTERRAQYGALWDTRHQPTFFRQFALDIDLLWPVFHTARSGGSANQLI